MILSDLRDCLKERKRIALKDLVDRFNMDEDALRGMLGKWISKGNVRRLPTGTACSSGCGKCDPALTELYEWVEKI
ncbi:FeoC-like transcriptional regulator [Crenothrix polyspora]|jgi:putative ferrous iron transport protein C|uniref:FeoC-like transcriptional regulator n=1 Tax=Crenothrix polyspora TaxID=360316 RepID=A0A1R4H669_9GAMM|nr:FeoC-like transcriptional regulator [Crenothrix polyspora]SJM91724.1 FeoC-like transcriptional regulator [Crenothrix polyspora]